MMFYMLEKIRDFVDKSVRSGSTAVYNVMAVTAALATAAFAKTEIPTVDAGTPQQLSAEFAVGSKGKSDPPKKVEIPVPKKFGSPVHGKDWKPDDNFGADFFYPGPNGNGRPAGTLIGEKMNLPAGTKVVAAADGLVHTFGVNSSTIDDPRCGGCVILLHSLGNKRTFYTVYTGIIVNKNIKKGSVITQGTEIGTVAPGMSKEGGFWPKSGLYTSLNLDPTGKKGDMGGLVRTGPPQLTDRSWMQGKLIENQPPFRRLDCLPLSEVLANDNPLIFLQATEKARQPKKK